MSKFRYKDSAKDFIDVDVGLPHGVFLEAGHDNEVITTCTQFDSVAVKHLRDQLNRWLHLHSCEDETTITKRH